MNGRAVAFLRGLNVGGHRIRMARLREIFEDLGYEEPATVLASGNVVFDPTGRDEAEVEHHLEAGLEEALGYAVPTFLRSVRQVGVIVEEGPISIDELDGPDFAHYVLFLKGGVDAEVRARFESLTSQRDVFRFGEREVHWLSRGKISDSPLFGTGFDRATRGLPHTMRNARTLQRLVSKFGA